MAWELKNRGSARDLRRMACRLDTGETERRRDRTPQEAGQKGRAAQEAGGWERQLVPKDSTAHRCRLLDKYSVA